MGIEWTEYMYQVGGDGTVHYRRKMSQKSRKKQRKRVRTRQKEIGS